MRQVEPGPGGPVHELQGPGGTVDRGPVVQHGPVGHHTEPEINQLKKCINQWIYLSVNYLSLLSLDKYDRLI